MTEENFIELATRYLSKESTPDENIQLNELLKREEYNNLFKLISEKWNSATDISVFTPEHLSDKFNILISKIKNYDPSFTFYKEKKPKTYFSQPYLLRIAASIIFLMILSAAAIYYWSIINHKNDMLVWNNKTTMIGEKSSVLLSDGTKIILNADSKLKFPLSFNKETREVYLDGEAYFEVAHDSVKRFVVHTGNISTTVLGTRFNVCAYSNERNISVSLLEGKVRISSDKNILMKEGVLLTPLQQFTYNIEEAKESIEAFDSQKVIGWKDNILIFDDDSLSKVFIHLERAFGIKFILVDKSFGDLILKANFEKESPLTIAEVIKKATGLSYKSTKQNNMLKEIIFYKK